MGILTVYLDKATDLKDDDMIGKSDPYVKFELEQDNTFRDKDYGEQKSTKKKDDLNPVYGETFHFNIPTLKNMELKVKVMDDDTVSDDKIGSCKIELEKLGLSSEPMAIEKTVDRKLLSTNAKIYLQLSYSD